MRLGVGLPGPFWISTRIGRGRGGCGCLSLLILPFELSLWAFAVVVMAYVALAKYLWPHGWWGKAITVAIPIIAIIIGSVSGASGGSQPGQQSSASASTSAPGAQAEGSAAAAVPSVSSSPAHTAIVYLDNKYRDGYANGKTSWKHGEERYRELCLAAGQGDGPHWVHGCEAGMRAAAAAYVAPAEPTGCHPLSDEGTCYEPGEYCRNSDHGASGVAGDGESIKCEDNDGWRWEPATSQPTSAPPAPPAQPTGCHPLSDEGTCYEPGEYCRDSDHGASGVAGDGESIKCEDNDGWRWEPV
ncbi:MAG TPA: hypothetical protein VGI58_16530 [Streptosporangiaceae bacterium]|jgi:hypothetical protein